MTNKKISILTGASVPLAGTEVIPIVQSGATVKVAVSDLTAGRTVDGLNFQVGAAGQFRGSDDSSYVIYQASTISGAAALYMSGSTRGSGLAGSASYACGDFNIYNPVFTALKFTVAGATGNAALGFGNLSFGTAAKGINFTANTPAAGMTSQLLNWYEEGTWTPTDQSGAGLSLTIIFARYVRIGRQIIAECYIQYPINTNAALNSISLPFTASKYIIGTAGASAGNVTSIISVGANPLASLRNVTLNTVSNIAISGADVLFTLNYTI